MECEEGFMSPSHKAIPGTFGLYKINQFAEITCIDKKPVKIIEVWGGYEHFEINSWETMAIHVAMGRAYLGLRINDTRHVHHIDLDPSNNNLWNLEILHVKDHIRYHANLRRTAIFVIGYNLIPRTY
jgi:hypothetical protein